MLPTSPTAKGGIAVHRQTIADDNGLPKMDQPLAGLGRCPPGTPPMQVALDCTGVILDLDTKLILLPLMILTRRSLLLVMIFSIMRRFSARV